MSQCLDKGGAVLLGPGNYVKAIINHYAPLGDLDRTLILYERLLELEPKSAENWIKAANLYLQLGNEVKAIEAATKAGDLDSKVKEYADDFIKKISQ